MSAAKADNTLYYIGGAALGALAAGGLYLLWKKRHDAQAAEATTTTKECSKKGGDKTCHKKVCHKEGGAHKESHKDHKEAHKEAHKEESEEVKKYKQEVANYKDERPALGHVRTNAVKPTTMQAFVQSSIKTFASVNAKRQGAAVDSETLWKDVQGEFAKELSKLIDDLWKEYDVDGNNSLNEIEMRRLIIHGISQLKLLPDIMGNLHKQLQESNKGKEQKGGAVFDVEAAKKKMTTRIAALSGKDMMAHWDVDKDGVVSKDEFVKQFEAIVKDIVINS